MKLSREHSMNPCESVFCDRPDGQWSHDTMTALFRETGDRKTGEQKKTEGGRQDEIEIKGYIHSTESFGTVDGPGIRFVVFFQGCPMRCLYCHNPDTWKLKAASQMTVEEILAEYERNREFYRTGGLTATGGEPLMQLPFLIRLFEAAKEHHIHTCLDTSGIMFRTEQDGAYRRLAAVTDLVLLDIKHGDETSHRNLTRRSGKPVWDFLHFLDQQNIPVWIRHVLVPGLTDGREDLKRLGGRLSAFGNVKVLDVLPYHKMGEIKYEELGLTYPLKGLNEPTADEVRRAKQWIMEGYRQRRKSSVSL